MMRRQRHRPALNAVVKQGIHWALIFGTLGCVDLESRKNGRPLSEGDTAFVSQERFGDRIQTAALIGFDSVLVVPSKSKDSLFVLHNRKVLLSLGGASAEYNIGSAGGCHENIWLADDASQQIYQYKLPSVDPEVTNLTVVAPQVRTVATGQLLDGSFMLVAEAVDANVGDADLVIRSRSVSASVVDTLRIFGKLIQLFSDDGSEARIAQPLQYRDLLLVPHCGAQYMIARQTPPAIRTDSALVSIEVHEDQQHRKAMRISVPTGAPGMADVERWLASVLGNSNAIGSASPGLAREHARRKLYIPLRVPPYRRGFAADNETIVLQRFESRAAESWEVVSLSGEPGWSFSLEAGQNLVDVWNNTFLVLEQGVDGRQRLLILRKSLLSGASRN